MTGPEPSARCMACRYILDGCTSASCPECGRPFDLNDPSTYLGADRRVFAWESVVAAVALVVCLGLLLPEVGVTRTWSGGASAHLHAFMFFLWMTPWLVITPAFALLTLRRVNASRGSRVLATVVLVAFAVNPMHWAAPAVYVAAIRCGLGADMGGW